MTTLVRWILPKRFLTFATSTTVNNTQKPLNCDDEILARNSKILPDTVNDESKISDDNKDSDANAISDNDDLEISNNKRVTFSLYD